MKQFLTVALLVLLCGTASAQHHAHSFKPTQGKFPIIPNLGNLNHPVTTRNPTAQKYFNQGLTLIYGFNYDGAYASFREAFNEDRSLAMAHWGMALALGANINIDITGQRMREAADHIRQARALASNATPYERDYIEALARRYSTDPLADWMQLAINYSQAMQQLWKRYPLDPDAGTLYAESLMDLRPWRLWTLDGKPVEGTLHILDVINGVLKYAPNHLGAVHYHLHALEPSPRWREAVGDARQLTTLVPNSGHLVHMPSHIFLLMGDYAAAARSNRDAIAVDKNYIASYGGNDGYIGHYMSHNYHFLAVAETFANNYAAALEAAQEAAALARKHIAEEPGLEHYMATPTLVLVNFRRWEEVVKMPEPDRNRLLLHTIWNWARGMAFAAQGKVQEARREQQEFRRGMSLAQSYRTNPADPTSSIITWGNNPSSNIFAIADNQLNARIANAIGDTAAATQLLQFAVEAKDALLYDEPPPWFLQPRASLGAALLMEKRYREAEAVFREDLRRTPNHVPSLFGLYKSLEGQGRRESATARRQFRAVWRDTSLQLRIEDL